MFRKLDRIAHKEVHRKTSSKIDRTRLFFSPSWKLYSDETLQQAMPPMGLVSDRIKACQRQQQQQQQLCKNLYFLLNVQFKLEFLYFPYTAQNHGCNFCGQYLTNYSDFLEIICYDAVAKVVCFSGLGHHRPTRPFSSLFLR